MLKRILALLLCFTVLVVSAGCSDTQSPSPETSIIDVSSNVDDEYVNPKDYSLRNSESFDFDYEYFMNNTPGYEERIIDTPPVGHISCEEEAIQAAYEVWERFYDQEDIELNRECIVHYDFRSDVWYVHGKWEYIPGTIPWHCILNAFIKSDGTVMNVMQEI